MLLKLDDVRIVAHVFQNAKVEVCDHLIEKPVAPLVKLCTKSLSLDFINDAELRKNRMTRMDAALVKKKLNAQMLLQVHDELVFEVPQDEVERTLPVIKAVMEDAPHPAVTLSVPLQVDARAAQNWEEAH